MRGFFSLRLNKMGDDAEKRRSAIAERFQAFIDDSELLRDCAQLADAKQRARLVASLLDGSAHSSVHSLQHIQEINMTLVCRSLARLELATCRQLLNQRYRRVGDLPKPSSSEAIAEIDRDIIKQIDEV